VDLAAKVSTARSVWTSAPAAVWSGDLVTGAAPIPAIKRQCFEFSHMFVSLSLKVIIFSIKKWEKGCFLPSPFEESTLQ
jgi:hypothetical protein